jgi:hypothetical protein
MLVSMEVPDQIAHSLHLDEPRGIRRALETLALQGYKAGELSRGQVSKMLGFGFYETEGFLKAHNSHPEMTMEELEEERQALASVLGQ